MNLRGGPWPVPLPESVALPVQRGAETNVGDAREKTKEVIVKKIVTIAAVLGALVAFAGCASKPATPPPPPPAAAPAVAKPVKIEDKGTLLGVPTPAWLTAAVSGGAQAVEKLPDYQNQYVVVVDDVAGKSLEGIQLAAQNLNAATEISRYLSLRVKETFAGAQVGDKDKIETYMERAVKSVSDATFSGFSKSQDWWLEVGYPKPDDPKTLENIEYRYYALYTIDKSVLKQQLDKILASAASAEQNPTPDKQKAIDLVQQSFYNGF